MSIAAIIAIIVQLLPIVFDLIQKAEGIYTGIKQGSLKKSYVMDTLEGIILGSSQFFDLFKGREDSIMKFADFIIEFVGDSTGIFGTPYKIDISPKEVTNETKI